MLFAHRVHESLALSAILAGSLGLHVIWILHVLMARSEAMRELLTISQNQGPISGLYLVVGLKTFAAFWVISAILHGRDCSQVRRGALWFFVISFAAFFLFTLPQLYAFVSMS